MQTVAGYGVTCIKRRRRDLSSDGVRNLATASGRGRLKEDLESSTCPEVEKDVDMVIINDGEEEESSGDEFKLRRREKGKGIEEARDTPLPTPNRSPRTHIAPLSSDKETLQELTVTTKDAPSSADKEKL
ncbi:hypothetical protein Tco_0682338 [Tanacetum coccineum]|uniref:Uncharacterized protein n=1 Tax=Tanacetum coccineum TaxID=301880 RepID=A0ABQ4XSS1_9ASTR